MGQAYSSQHTSSLEDERQPEASQSTARNSTATTARAQPLNSVRGTGARERQPRRSRFSPYGLFSSPRRQPRQSSPPQTAESAAGSAVTGFAAAGAAGANNSRMSLDTIRTERMDIDMNAEIDDEDYEDDGGDEEGVTTAGDASNNRGSRGWSRERIRAGNELLSRIVSRSAIASVAQELERRQSSTDTIPYVYQMGPAERVELYFRISAFIQSALQTDLESHMFGDTPVAPTGGPESQSEQQPESQPEQQRQPEQQHQPERTTRTTAAGDVPGLGPHIPSLNSNQIMSETNFRFFLLPSAIDQALEAYEREHREAANGETTTGDTSNGETTTGETEQTPNEAAPNAREPQAGELHENQGPNENEGRTATSQSRVPHMREPNEDERRRAEQQRSREENLQRLRTIAQATGDERRDVQFPVMMLGLRLNPELRQQTRAVIESFNDGPVTSSGSSSTSLVVEDSSVTNTGNTRTPMSPETVPLVSEAGQPRGFLSRMNTILPNLLDLITSLRRVHNAASRSSNGGADSAARQTDYDAESTTSAASDSSSASQPGIAVYIMIHYMNLGNPLILPLVTHALFPELGGDSAGSSTASLRPVSVPSNSNNYDLFLEIANIIGQVTATTVSQDIVDKKLRTYVFEGGVEARLVDEETRVQLVSAERCPVCLEGFEVGDMLRVLTCCHGLHKACGDAWFTQGANKCPVCRAEAVHSSMSSPVA
ncbi:hypothetical protein IWW56_001598 [Coemansia sp. RSA 2131]|nr:hypothetical protein IWW56_001598 [Coemansia sp. RSA 2131]